MGCAEGRISTSASGAPPEPVSERSWKATDLCVIIRCADPAKEAGQPMQTLSINNKLFHPMARGVVRAVLGRV